ncbi:MAG: hypothetical protein GY778_07700 [bacterium]|nr:hypothetical protein [bacterium]
MAHATPADEQVSMVAVPNGPDMSNWSADIRYSVSSTAPEGWEPSGTVIQRGARACPCSPNTEGEACGAAVNEGCNATPFAFNPITCGQTVCGEAYALGGTRDTDWYRLLVAAETEITWTVTSEIPVRMAILWDDTPVCGNPGGPVNLANAYSDACTPGSVTACLQPGTYYLWIGTGAPGGDIFDGYPCTGANSYEATLTCQPCPPIGACCLPGGACTDGISDPACTGLGGTYQGNATDCTPNCCDQPGVTGHDTCAGAITVPVPTDGSEITINGNNSGATQGGDPDGCFTNMQEDGIWWESFSIGTCADVHISFCCTGPATQEPMWILLASDCPCTAAIQETAHNFGGGTLLEECDANTGPSQLIMTYDDLPAGTYWIPILADTAEGSPLQDYAIHISATPVTGACCDGSTCSAPCHELCEGAGANYLGDASTCGTQCDIGACCDIDAGICLGTEDEATCTARPENTRYIGGSSCALNPCAPPNDLCENATEIILDVNNHGEATTDDTNATVSTTDPPLPCFGCDSCDDGLPCCDPASEPSGCLGFGTLWFKFTTDATATDYEISTCDSTGEFDTVMSLLVVPQTPFDCNTLTMNDTWGAPGSEWCGCSEDGPEDGVCVIYPGGPYNSTIEARGLLTNTEYYIVTTPFDNPARGSITVTIDELLPLEGGCCSEVGTSGVFNCVEGQLLPDCQALGGRWNQESAPDADDGCLTMNPQCGSGACCTPTGVFGSSHCTSPLDKNTCEGPLTNFQGVFTEGATCATLPEPCTGECCIGGVCQPASTNGADCAGLGGQWFPGPVCSADPSACDNACQDGIGCQSVAYPTGGRTSDLADAAAIRAADNFKTTTGGDITEVCWWGFYLNFGTESDCVPPRETWTITYYADDAGGDIPGTMIVSHVVTATVTKVATGYHNGSSASADFRYDATHPAVTTAADTCYWIEITNLTGRFSNCFWLWDNDTATGDSKAAQTTAVVPDYFPGDEIADEDYAFCLNVATDPNSCGGGGAVPAATGWVSCVVHDPAGNEGPPTTWCSDIAEAAPRGGPDPRTDTQIEGRFFGIGGSAPTSTTVEIALDGAATPPVTVDAVCTDASTHGATVTVSTDGLTVTAVFNPALPNTESCTMTLGGGASGSQVIKLLAGDVNGSGRVNATDKNFVKGKITSRTPPLVGDDFFYDVNASGRINATDKNLVKGRITGSQNELDVGCP